jgi:hypothetical protein
MQRLLGIAILTVAALVACGGSSDEIESASDDLTGAARARVTRAQSSALRFDSAIAARVDACKGDCLDADGDGLVDAWEAAVLDKLRPAVTFDEDEPLMKDGGASFAMLGRVFPGAGGHVVVNVLLLYTSDYGAQNPVCFHKSKHAGDVERVAMELELDGASSAGGARVIAAFTTGHEGTEDDQSRVWKNEELGSALRYLDDATTHEPRWQVFPSQNKHATYATIEQCQSVHLKQWTHDFCIDEDCAPDRVRDATRFTRIPTILNAGEPGAPLTDDLRPLGFAGERAWSDDTFCGGLRVDAEAKKECPPSIKSKLLKNPFAG